MQILVDTPTKLVITICDIEYSKPGEIINIASIVIFAIIFFYLVSITGGHILIALLIASGASSPIFVMNNVWLGRQNKFFTFDKALKKLVIERQSCFVFRVTCASGLFLIIFFILSYSSITKYTSIADIAGIFFVSLLLSYTTFLIPFCLFKLLFHKTITNLIRWQYLSASKVKVREYWLRHINDVKIQCVETSSVAYGVVIRDCRCKIILLGALHIEIENDHEERCDKQLAQYLADRIKGFLVN